MQDEIKWSFSKNKINDVHLDMLESKYAIRLPKVYRSLAKSHNGARPSKKIVYIDKDTEWIIKSFLPIDSVKGSIYEVKSWLNKYLPAHSIPFASDPFGNYFIFISNNSFENPEVFLWNHEKQEVMKIASSFKEFLSLLR